jgi:hypothetical protein
MRVMNTDDDDDDDCLPRSPHTSDTSDMYTNLLSSGPKA